MSYFFAGVLSERIRLSVILAFIWLHTGDTNLSNVYYMRLLFANKQIYYISETCVHLLSI